MIQATAYGLPRLRTNCLCASSILREHGREGQNVFETLIIIGIVLVALGSLAYVMGRPNRYSQMTDQEFEEDTKRGPGLGAAIIGMERALRRREADYVIEQKLRVEKNATPSGDKPHPEDDETGNSPHK
jgi:hypothetical protein